ncbi:LicD family protein [Chryseobacterium viscerum]|uniref:LicD family protein n=1 Tax=Chryseobacterium viscerum TaxID=1037377 RepID=UPI0022236AC1|nr:LicD family protein [Chryseobacterium viscerum]MCW1962534.1 LicD family protein [Chryseobacterium viscerum]
MIFQIKEGAIYSTAGNETVEISSNITVLSNDQNFHKNKYGFEISPTDIQNYAAHIFIWEYILKNDITIPCIIIENDVKLKHKYEELRKDIDSLPNEWDLIIPYNKLQGNTISRNEIFPSRLGYYWGSYIYVINGEKITSMDCLKSIKQPIDEEILECSFNNSLKTLVIDTGWFDYDEENCPIYKSRGAFFIEKIKKINLWEERHKEQAVEILKYLGEKAKELNLSLFAHAGTLLGIIRHDDIMPWDDDIDLCIDENEIQLLLRAVENDNIIKYTKRIWHKTGSEYYKFFYKDGEYKEGYDYTFPFVDIWLLFHKEESSYMTSDGYEVPMADYFPGKAYELYKAPILVPHNHESILQKMYKNWDKYIKVFSWSHRKKENCIDSIIAPIQTDGKGRLMNQN